MTQLKTIFLLFLLLPALSLADTTQSIQLNKYYQATCADYTGTWNGFFTDTTDLFGNSGPWPIQISLYNQGSNLVGIANANKFVSNIMTGSVWAQCQNGQLSNIFLGDKRTAGAASSLRNCGALSQTGVLVSKNVLIMEIHWENAMTGTTFLTVLKRTNNNYLGKIPKNTSDMELGTVETCH